MHGFTLGPRCALAHDYLLVMRGAERTFAAMADCWPDAPIYTLLYDEAGTGGRFSSRRVLTSPLQRLGASQQGFRRLLPAFPLATEALRVADVELLVSSSSAFAHGLRKPAGATHVCYCHSPFRYAWHERRRALAEAPRALRPALDLVLRGIRRWDRRAAAGVDHYIANSRITQERIGRFYGRDAPIVHPPVDISRFTPGEPEDWFLVVSELVAHKRIDSAIEAARRGGARVKVVGSGPEEARLARRYQGAVELLGRVDDAHLSLLYARARAVIVPNEEEFGIVAVEAQAAGRPVVGLNAGGTRETVIDGRTGVLVDAATPEALAEALSDVDFDRFDPAEAVENASRFSTEVFRERLVAEVERLTGLGRAVPGV